MPHGPPGAAPSAPAPGTPRFRAGVAWAAILLLVGAVAVLQARPSAAGAGGFAARVLETQVRFQYGMRELVRGLPGPTGPPEILDLQVLRESLGKGPASTRQRIAVVAGDVAGPAAAREDLDRLESLLKEKGRALEGNEAAVQEALRALYAGDGPAHGPEAVEALPPEKRDLLRGSLGWFGRLALAPEGSPDRAAVLDGTDRLALIFMGALAGGLALLAVGLIAALVYWMRVSARGASFRFASSSTPPGVYAETFAVWLGVFLAMSVAGGLLGGLTDAKEARFAAVASAQLLSLGALAWPVIRGVPFRQVRSDLGLRLSATPVRDALAGIGCWVLGLPVIAAVALATFTAMAFVAAVRGKGDDLESPAAGHPIVDEIARGFPWLLVLVLASVLAPLVEEIFFRGVLYRHLRDTTRARGRAASIALSAILSGLVFGAIHPQGVLLIPLLAAVAWPLVHAREWRDSLVAPMAAHAWHNAVVTGSAWVMLGS